MKISKVIGGQAGYLNVIDENGKEWKRSGGTVAWRCNNPGNLKMGPFSKSYGAIGKDHIGHAVFPTKEMGEQAQYGLLFSENGRYYNLTLLDAIKRYAPSSDNNYPIKYQMYLSRKTGIDRDDKLKTLPQEKRMKLLKYMQIYEGYKRGKDVLLGSDE